MRTGARTRRSDPLRSSSLDQVGLNRPKQVSDQSEQPASRDVGGHFGITASAACRPPTPEATSFERQNNRGCMRRRLRKKLHREFLTTVCAYVVTFDDELRKRLLEVEPGMPFPIEGKCSPGMQRLLRGRGLRYAVTVARKLAPATAVVVYWAEEFPSVRDEAVIFSLDDLGLSRDDLDRTRGSS